MNRFLFIAILVILVGCLGTHAAKHKPRKKEASKVKCMNNICVKVLGKSGKISFWKRSKKESDALVLSFDYIKEVDSNGTKLTGAHTYENFAKTDFLFSEPVNTTVLGAKATSFDFQAYLSGPNANLTVEIFIISEEKKISLCDGVEYTVTPGTVKFNVEIDNWTFCGGVDGDNCAKNVTGAAVDMAIEVKPRGGKKAEKKKGSEKNEKKHAKKYRLDNMVMSLPAAIEVDDKCSSMAAGWPNIEQKGPKQITNLRFPRFKSKVIYDPIVSEYTSKAASSAAVSFTLIASLAFLVHLVY